MESYRTDLFFIAFAIGVAPLLARLPHTLAGCYCRRRRWENLAR